MERIQIGLRSGGTPLGFPAEEVYRDKQPLSSGEFELVIYRAQNETWHAAFREVLDDDLWDRRFQSSSQDDLIEQMLDPMDRPLMTMAVRVRDTAM